MISHASTAPHTIIIAPITARTDSQTKSLVRSGGFSGCDIALEPPSLVGMDQTLQATEFAKPA